MATQLQIAANWNNAQSSTGPRTPEGKAAVSQNAFKHGLASAFCVLPHEDQAGFDSLCDNLREELSPDGEHENFLVDQMAQARWKIARIQRLETALFEDLIENGADPTDDPDRSIAAGLLGPAGKTLASLQRYAAAAERSYLRCYTELIRCRKNLHNEVNKQNAGIVEALLNAPAPHALYGDDEFLDLDMTADTPPEPSAQPSAV